LRAHGNERRSRHNNDGHEEKRRAMGEFLLRYYLRYLHGCPRCGRPTYRGTGRIWSPVLAKTPPKTTCSGGCWGASVTPVNVRRSVPSSLPDAP